MKDNKKYAYCVMLLCDFNSGDINMKYHVLGCYIEEEREKYFEDGFVRKEYDVVPRSLYQKPEEYEFNQQASVHTVSTIYEDYDIALEKCRELNQEYKMYKDSHKVLSYRRF